MFARLHLGYLTFLALAGCVFLFAAAVGKTPLIGYFLFSFRNSFVLIWVLPPLLWFGLVAVQIALRRVPHPSRTVFRLARRQRAWLLRGTLLTFLALPLSRALSAIKDAIPQLVPFYADPYFIELDRSIFGVDPWHLTHALFGPFETLLIDRIYSLWFFVMMGTLAWLAFTRDQKLQVRGLLAYNLSWFLLGNVLAVVFSSVGPCFVQDTYGRADFLPLTARLSAIAADYPLNSLWSKDYLQRTLGTESFGGGISAMPSLHVANAFLIWLICLNQMKSRLIKVLAGAFAFAILIGSVHLGWHYAVDGLVAIIGVVLIWWGSGRFVDWVGAREARLARADLNPAGAVDSAAALVTPAQASPARRPA